MPEGPWSFYQEWNDAVFLHWKVDRERLRAMVPASLELDEIDGVCWISVVAFTMQRIRLRGLPAYAPVSDFHELNVRTYVRHDGMAGVYFLSIEAASRISCWSARRLSALPYAHARIRRVVGTFTARSTPLGEFHLAYRTGHPLTRKEQLDRWLTERYALFVEKEGHPVRYQTHHLEWPVRACELIDGKCTPLAWPGLFSGSPDRMHYSPGVAVLAWGAEPC